MEQDFFFIFFISYKNGESEEATIFPAKMGRAKKRFFFQRKKRNIDVIFRLEKKIGVSKQKWSGEIIIIKNWCFKKNGAAKYLKKKKNQSR